MVTSLTSYARRGVLHLALAIVLAGAGAIDLAHDHAADIDTRSCYTCHFSVDLEVQPRAPAGAAIRALVERLGREAVAASVATRTQAFEARGPPLLS